MFSFLLWHSSMNKPNESLFTWLPKEWTEKKSMVTGSLIKNKGLNWGAENGNGINISIRTNTW